MVHPVSKKLSATTITMKICVKKQEKPLWQNVTMTTTNGGENANKL